MAIGCPHPDYLNNILSSYQIAEWQAFYSIRMFGEEAKDLRQAYTSNLIALGNDIKKKSGADLTIKDFLLKEEHLTEIDTELKQKHQRAMLEVMQIMAENPNSKVNK